MVGRCEIEYDANKRLVNLTNRGVDFKDALRVFAGRTLSKVDERQDYGAERIITAGKLDGRIVKLVWTWRGEKRRIISMRYANDRERRELSRYLD